GGAGGWAALGRRGGLTSAADVLGHGVGCRVPVVEGLLEGIDVGAAGGLLDLFDGGENRGLVGFADLVAGLLDHLVGLPDGLVGLLAQLGQLAFFLVVVGMRLGV